MTQTIAVSKEKRSAKDQPSYRMIRSIDAEAPIKRASADHETIGTIGTSATVRTGFVQIVMELLHRYSGLKVSVVYRVPDGLNCLNEQRSLPSGSRFE
jgi:hypothetical protein